MTPSMKYCKLNTMKMKRITKTGNVTSVSRRGGLEEVPISILSN